MHLYMYSILLKCTQNHTLAHTQPINDLVQISENGHGTIDSYTHFESEHDKSIKIECDFTIRFYIKKIHGKIDESDLAFTIPIGKLP